MEWNIPRLIWALTGELAIKISERLRVVNA